MMGNELEKKKINFFFLGGVQKEVFPGFGYSHTSDDCTE